ncbi:MAG TPA: hypothetical protein VGR91_08045 [Stellaceae bacterium]|nr:hypothetical protein [Stellaceae bacterium]
MNGAEIRMDAHIRRRTAATKAAPWRVRGIVMETGWRPGAAEAAACEGAEDGGHRAACGAAKGEDEA